MIAAVKDRGSQVRRALVAVVVVFALAACGISTDEDRAGLVLGNCPAPLMSQLLEYATALAPKMELGCGELEVPLDYAHPEGEQINLQIIRARHQEQSDRIGSLIFNPGGPGDPGVEYTPYLLSWLPESLLLRFDVVTLDPRGTGGSAPINCPAPAGGPQSRSSNVLTEAGYVRAERAERQQSELCLRLLGARAPHFSTQTAARDIDRLRAAVGDQTLNYLGMSYAAKLGAEYARQFPDSVRAAVLDGPSEPGATHFDNLVRQAEGFESSFNEYAKGCATRPSCRLGDPHAFVKRLVARADAKPIPTGITGERPADGSDVLEAVRSALYDEALWPSLDSTLYDANDYGNSTGLFLMAEGLYGPPIEDSAPFDRTDARYVIDCNDTAVGPTDEQIRTTARALARKYPIIGAYDAAYLFDCKTWQPQRAALESPVAPTPNRLLVVGTVHDAGTPYVGAVALTRSLGNATLLTWDGKSHTATAFSDCVAGAVTRYFVDLTLPPDGTHCPP